MGLRPPRVAIVFEGGAKWHLWARLAIHAATMMWGGRGFILVPHQAGEVRPDLLEAVRRYDPDYVVSLRVPVHLIDAAKPSLLRIVDQDGANTEGEERSRLLAQLGDQAAELPADGRARDTVAAACSPHRRRGNVGGEVTWLEDVSTLDVDGNALRLTKTSDVTDPGTRPWRSCPPTWDGAIGVAVAAQCGAFVLPQVGDEPPLEDQDLRGLIYWLLAPDSSVASLPPDLVWHPTVALHMEPASLDDAFEATTAGLVMITRGFQARRSTLLMIGDNAEDFALAYAHRQLYGAGVWLPTAWWADERTKAFAETALRSLASQLVHRGQHLVLATTSVGEDAMAAINIRLREPLVWAEGDRAGAEQRYRDHIDRSTTRWPNDGVCSLAIDGQFDQDYAVPVARNVTGDAEMVVSTPLPVVTNAMLANASTLHYQVELELAGMDIPRGRQFDGHSLLAETEDPYLTWVRSGRDGVTYESERFNLVLAGTPETARLARPRLRVPQLGSWAHLRATQDDRQMRLSAAGRRVEVMRQLWGSRSTMIAQFAGPMLSALRAFRPVAKRTDIELAETDGVVLPTGAGAHLYEGYLTFAGLAARASATSASEAAFRDEVDQLLERGILRRGLVVLPMEVGDRRHGL